MSAPTNGYIGHGVSNLDNRGRFTLPVAYRTVVQQTSQEPNSLNLRACRERPCIFGFGDHFIDLITRELDRMAEAASDNVLLTFDNPIFSNILSDIASITLDGGGRFNLPPYLREHAGITDTLFIVGARHQFEMWQPERYLEFGNPGVIPAAACRALIAAKAADGQGKGRAA
jgi:MraZ protein